MAVIAEAPAVGGEAMAVLAVGSEDTVGVASFHLTARSSCEWEDLESDDRELFLTKVDAECESISWLTIAAVVTRLPPAPVMWVT